MVSRMRRIAKALREAVVAGGQAAIKARLAGLRIKRKSAIDLTTSSDLASEAAFTRIFEQRCPGVGIFSEEEVEAAGTHGRVPQDGVIVDPLDGSLNFLRRQPSWGVMGTYFEHGRPLASAICQPETSSLMVADAEDGVFLGSMNPSSRLERIVLKPQRCGRLFLCAEVHRFTSVRDISRGLLRFIRAGCVVSNVSSGTSADGILSLLRGQIDLYLNCSGGKIWDFAAGACAVELAGGVALDSRGRALRFRSWQMDVALCANASVARLARSILGKK